MDKIPFETAQVYINNSSTRTQLKKDTGLAKSVMIDNAYYYYTLYI